MIDLRDLADEWRELEDALTEGEDYDEQRMGAIRDLARELCFDADDPECITPDDLERWANDYEPTLIPEGEFEDYARQLAEDIGAIPEGLQWPVNCIDWGRAARELRYDYTLVTFDGDEYLIRSV